MRLDLEKSFCELFAESYVGEVRGIYADWTLACPSFAEPESDASLRERLREAVLLDRQRAVIDVATGKELDALASLYGTRRR